MSVELFLCLSAKRRNMAVACMATSSGKVIRLIAGCLVAEVETTSVAQLSVKPCKRLLLLSSYISVTAWLLTIDSLFAGLLVADFFLRSISHVHIFNFISAILWQQFS